jgi:hypothetical protein
MGGKVSGMAGGLAGGLGLSGRDKGETPRMDAQVGRMRR